MNLLADVRRIEMGEFMTSDATANGPASADWEEWAKDLARRLQPAKPEDTVRGLFSNGILDAVRSLAGDEAARRCLEASGQPKFVDFFNYPIHAHLQLVYTGARYLAPRYGSIEEALRQLGRRLTSDFLNSAAGKTMNLLARGDPKRLLDTLPSAYRVSLTFGTQVIEWTGPTSGRYILERDFIPVPYHEGVLAALLETTHVPNVKVQGRRLGLLDSEYDFSWG
jgi:uncharacterized protein (TIGR02265 family)